MTPTSSGFIITGVDSIDYTEAKKPGEGGLVTSFFDRFGVKSIGETHHSSVGGRSAESGAARGSCATYEVKT